MGSFNYTEIVDKQERSSICNNILTKLPNWFGNPVALADYVEKVSEMPFYACIEDDKAVGFVAIKTHNSYTAEVCVMGVLSEYHRNGIGANLIDLCVEYCKRHNHRYLTVKTLADLNPDEGYAKTRSFYLSQGFCPLEVFTEIWDEQNPCLFMVRSI